MRWILYLLLAANAIYLYLNIERWQLQQAAPKAEAPALVKRLVLLNEAGSERLRRRRTRDAMETSGFEGSASEPAASRADSQGDDNEAATASATTPAVPLLSLACYSVGPIASDDERDAVAQWLDEQGARAELREDERREVSRYWVHIAPLPTADAAVAEVERLRAAGIEDMHVIRRGNMANAVSLGLYSRKSYLDRRVQKLAAVGVDAKVEERYQSFKSSWFDVVLPADNPLEDEALAERFPTVASKARRCGQPKPAPEPAATATG